MCEFCRYDEENCVGCFICCGVGGGNRVTKFSVIACAGGWDGFSCAVDNDVDEEDDEKDEVVKGVEGTVFTKELAVGVFLAAAPFTLYTYSTFCEFE